MTDSRLWAKLDAQYYSNPKIVEILDYGSHADRMHIASILYCKRNPTTDGVVSEAAMRREVGGTTEEADLLVRLGLWHRPGHDCEECPEVPEGKVFVHDYPRHNGTFADRERRSAAGRAAVKARWANTDRMQSVEQSVDEAYTEDATNRIESKSKSKSKKDSLRSSSRGTRMSDGWTPSAAVVERLRSDVPTVSQESELVKFRDYWIAQPGQRGLKLDWDATYRNWIRTAAERQGGPRQQPSPTARPWAYQPIPEQTPEQQAANAEWLEQMRREQEARRGTPEEYLGDQLPGLDWTGVTGES